MSILSNLLDDLLDTFYAPACAQDPCSNGYSTSFDHNDPQHLQDVQIAAESDSFECGGGPSIGVDFASGGGFHDDSSCSWSQFD